LFGTYNIIRSLRENRKPSKPSIVLQEHVPSTLRVRMFFLTTSAEPSFVSIIWPWDGRCFFGGRAVPGKYPLRYHQNDMHNDHPDQTLPSARPTEGKLGLPCHLLLRRRSHPCDLEVVPEAVIVWTHTAVVMYIVVIGTPLFDRKGNVKAGISS
jgi:hypothetical protein